MTAIYAVLHAILLLRILAGGQMPPLEADLIEDVYRAGADPAGWSQVLASVTAQLGGGYGALHIGDVTGSGFQFASTYGLSIDAAMAYASHYYAINPITVPLSKLNRGDVIADHWLVPRAAYHASEFYNDYARRFDVEGTATAVLDCANGQMSCFSVVQHNGAEAYAYEDLAPLRQLLPHLQHAVELNRTLAPVRARHDAAAAALDLLDVGVFFLDRVGRVVHANAEAYTLLRTQPAITIQDRKLSASEPQSANRLAHALDAALGKPAVGSSVTASRAKPLTPVVIKVAPYLQPDFPEVRVIAIARNPDRLSPESLHDVFAAYDLTPAEAKFLSAFLDTCDVEKAAERLGMKLPTARSHMRVVMAKAGVSKQTELIRLVLTRRLPLR